MARKVKGARALEHQAQRDRTSSPTAAVNTPLPDAHVALVSLAEELGKLLAQRELALRNRRLGYSFVESILGLTVTGLMTILAYKAWLSCLR